MGERASGRGRWWSEDGSSNAAGDAAAATHQTTRDAAPPGRAPAGGCAAEAAGGGGRRKRTGAARRGCSLRARGWLSVLFAAGVLLGCVEGQYSFVVVFPAIGLNAAGFKDQPAVFCGTNMYPGKFNADGTTVYNPGSYSLPNAGSCQVCKSDVASGQSLCVNQFKIKTTTINTFTLLSEDVLVCDPISVAGVALDLNLNDYRISLLAKAPSYAAPGGNLIKPAISDCVSGKWTVTYTTTIAGQYKLTVEQKTGINAAGVEILTPLLNSATSLPSPFEIRASDVRPGIGGNTYFIDTVVSLRPICTTANRLSLECKHCVDPASNGGCTGNSFPPKVKQPSQMLLQAGDLFYNAVDDSCASTNDIGGMATVTALKIPFITTTNCDATGLVCLEALLIPRALTPLSVTTSCDLASPYLIKFQAQYAGFYALQIKGATNLLRLGPLVVPVGSAAVDATQSFAYGQGITGAVQSEQVTFTIQPIDIYGNHHTDGAHVFQVLLERLDAAGDLVFGAKTTVTPTDTGRGTSLVKWSLEVVATFRMSIKFCKDLTSYGPYTIDDNNVCDLSAASGGLGTHILGSPFTISVRKQVFTLPGSAQSGLMRSFTGGTVGVIYYAIFQSNFPACGQTSGTLSVDERFKPLVRFDIATLGYREGVVAEMPTTGWLGPSNPTLSAGMTTGESVTDGSFAKTRYASDGGPCIDDGYVFSFKITVSGLYNVWIYTDVPVSPKIVAESPRFFTVLPDKRVVANFRGTGAVVECTVEYECMMNRATTMVIQARDRFFNEATSCAETITIAVVPALQGADHFSITNLLAEENVGGVPMNGVPGIGIDIITRSGYVEEPIYAFTGTITSCTNGAYQGEIFATLSADYKVTVEVDQTPLFGSPYALTIFPAQIDIVLGESALGLVTYSRWVFYRVYFDRLGVGFVAEVVKTDVNNGQPWTYVRFNAIFADLQEPGDTGGKRDENPDARSSINCQNCRIHVPPSQGRLGYWYLSVYGYESDSFHTASITAYPDKILKPSVIQTGTIKPGHYAYYRFNMTKSSGFQVRVSATSTTQGTMTATMKLGGYPTTDRDVSSIFGQALWSPDRQDCIIDHPPTIFGLGEWYIAILGLSYPVDYQIILIEFTQTNIEFGSFPNELTLPSFTWGYYTFTIDADIEPDGFRLEIIPTDTKYNVTTVLKRSQHPITLSDSTFKSRPCIHCRITVMTRLKLQATWYIGVYAGATGANFQIKVKLLQSCPNDCFGNGKCVQGKIRACVCYPGYTGNDCRTPLKDKIFAWFPLDGTTLDETDNKVPLFFKVNKDGGLRYNFGGLALSATYIIIPKPTPRIICASFTSPYQAEEKDFQWSLERKVDEGSSPENRVTDSVPAEGPWYEWNELGDGTPLGMKGNPRRNKTCAEYNPRRELTVMMRIRMSDFMPSPGSFIGLGKPSQIIGRLDADDSGMWAWQFDPQRHPNGEEVVFDMYLRNATHEISVQENKIYKIDSLPIFEKPDFFAREFPDRWCIDSVDPARSDGICKYMQLNAWYHLTAVFGPKRLELYVDATLVGQLDLDLWNITNVVDGRIHIGHDPRYAYYERLLFGQVRDVRILRYAASKEEVEAVFWRGDTWFTNREMAKKASGVQANLGSWETPVELTPLDDGSLDPDISPHDTVCRMYRNPNEPRDLQLAAECPFVDTDTSWILREGFDHYYRKYDTDRLPYGLGHIETILRDTRPPGEVYLGRFYDFSIDEE